MDLNCLRSCLETARQLTTPLHLNVFPSTILSGPPERLVELLTEDHDPRTLCLEVSEQQFVGDPATLKDHVDVLRREGIKIAIDDMGFGRSSLEAWILLQPDIVKLDHRLLRSSRRTPRMAGW